MSKVFEGTMQYGTQSSDIAVNESNMQSGCMNIDDTRNHIAVEFETLAESNELLLQELTGDMKTAFSGATDTIEKQIKLTTGILFQLSGTIADYIAVNKKVNTDAGMLARGEKNE